MTFRSILTLVIALVAVMPQADAQQRRRKKAAAAVVSPYDVDTLAQPIPRQRALFHQYVDDGQRRADAGDGVPRDTFIHFGEDEAVSEMLSRALFKDIDQMQVMIENLPVAGDAQTVNQTKIRYLNALRDLLKRFNDDTRQDPFAYRRQVTNLKEMIIARHEGRLPEFAQTHATMASVANSSLLDVSPEAKAYIYKTVGAENPKVMIRRLNEYISEPFACDIIAAAARVVPNEVYSYANSTVYQYTSVIRNCSDPVVKSIVSIASESKSKIKALAFLDDLVNNRKTIAEVDKIIADQKQFYKNLVRLKMEGAQLGGAGLDQQIQLAGLRFVRDMNDLHESPDAVRFKVIDGLTPEEIYFLLVYGQDEIYTSSYTGAFKRLMDRMAPQPGDSLFEHVRYDRFRTFIRMAAGYNRLDQFLATIEEGRKNELMQNFMGGLEKGNEDDLEDAVDVADAFSSVEDPALAKFLEDQVRTNYERCKKTDARKGIIVYGLLSALFQGGVSGDEVGLPPVTSVPFASLEDSGVVYQQVYFYGDEDGRMSFQNFLGNFRDGKWKVQPDKFWTTIRSTSGKPIVIYANNPIAEPGDEEAQEKLKAYLREKEIHPAVLIHRGHSYHLPLSIEGLQKETKVVMLGSCGGYHNLGAVLDRSPDAQIISTKQTGTMSVNEPIVQAINNQLLEGKDINWPATWKTLNDQFVKKGGDPLAKFRDYVPPHKNLGAIFIKAYRKLSNSEAM